MVQDIIWFIFGASVYILIYLLYRFIYKKKFSLILLPQKNDNIFRLIFASLLLSICGLIFRPIWNKNSDINLFDPYRILLLFTGAVSLLTTYLLIKRNEKINY
jgi:hypothetical protein